MLPRWASWLVFIFLGYLIYTASRTPGGSTPESHPLIPPIDEKTYPGLAETLDPEHWKRSIDPAYAARRNCSVDAPKGGSRLVFKTIEDSIGSGPAAACGARIVIHLTVWNATGGKAYEATLPLTLGTRTVASGLDTGLVGIKPEGVRTLVLPPHALAHAKDTTAEKPLLKALPADKVAVVTVKRMQ